MKESKYAKVLAVVCTTIFVLSGCWDYKEIENMVIVAGIAIDTGSDNNYLVTIETIELEQSLGINVQPQSQVIHVEAPTVFDAIRNAIKISPNRLYWSHAKIVILSEEVAREGIIEALEIVMRAKEPRLTMYLLVSKEKTASEILPYDTLLDNIYSFEIVEMLKAQEYLSKAPDNQIYEVMDKLMAEGISAVIPTIGLSNIEGKKIPEVSGLAMLKRDNLVGFLDENEAKTFLFITDQIKGGVLTEIYPSQSSTSHIALNIYENKTKIKPRYDDGKSTMHIKTNTKTVLQEWGMASVSINEESVNQIKKQFEESLKNDIENLVEKVQKEYECDIFGFGNILKNQNPQQWKELEEDWGSIFADLNIEVDTNIDIINTGLLSNSIKVGD